MNKLMMCVLVTALGATVGGLSSPRAQPRDGSMGGRTYGGFGGRTYGGAPQPADQVTALARCFEQSARDRVAEGYYVKNYSFIRVVRAGLGNFNPLNDDSKGGRCGEYGEWGKTWIQPCVSNIPGAIVDDVFMIEKSSTYEWADSKYGKWSPDQIFEKNHRATRVVLPDGRRFIVDYWDGVGSGQPKMVPEAEWARKWRKAVGDQMIGIDDGVLIGSDDQSMLKMTISARNIGEARGFDLFRKKMKERGRDPEIWIKSWNLDPW